MISQFSSVQSLDHVRFFVTPWTVACQASLSIDNRHHHVGDAIQPSHSLSSSSPPAFNLPHHQGLFQWVISLHQVAKVLEFQLQHQSSQWIFKKIEWSGYSISSTFISERTNIGTHVCLDPVCLYLNTVLHRIQIIFMSHSQDILCLVLIPCLCP